MCSGIGYPFFYTPNFRGQRSTSEINTELHASIIRSNCSNALAHLLCSVYTPFCYHPSNPSASPQPIYPCYRLCKYVQDDCSSYFRGVNFTWPLMLDCDNREIFKNDSRSLIFCPPDIGSLRIPSDIGTESPTPDDNEDNDASKPSPDNPKFITRPQGRYNYIIYIYIYYTELHECHWYSHHAYCVPSFHVFIP